MKTRVLPTVLVFTICTLFLSIATRAQNTEVLPDRVSFPKHTSAEIENLTDTAEGQVVFDTEKNKLKLYNGTEWVTILTKSLEPTGKAFKVGEVASANANTRTCRDANGNTFVFGFYLTNTLIGNTTLSNFNDKLFLAKFDSLGTPLWVKTFGSWDEKRIADVEVDQNGNVFIAGAYRSDLTVDSFTLTATSSDFELFLIKFDNNGNALWAKKGGNASAYAQVDQMTLDNNGNPILGGFYSGSLNFDGTTISSFSNSNFIVKYNTSGSLEFLKSFANTTINDMAVTSTNEVVVSGTFGGTFNWGSNTFTSSGSQDIYITKLNSSGNSVWARGFGGFNSEYFPVLAISPLDTIYLASLVSLSEINFQGTVIGSTIQFHPNNILLLKLNNSGNLEKGKFLAYSGSFIQLRGITYNPGSLGVNITFTGLSEFQNTSINSVNTQTTVGFYDPQSLDDLFLSTPLIGTSISPQMKKGLDGKVYLNSFFGQSLEISPNTKLESGVVTNVGTGIYVFP